jgi:hypothetical protein
MIESLFKQCCYEIAEKLSNHQIILPVNGIVTVEFYLDQFYEFIKKAIESSLKNIDSEYSEKVPVIFCAYFLVFKRDIKRMSKSVINDTWESLRIFRYFNELLGRKILNEEDYMEVDKAICDYFNIMRCINEAKNDQRRTSVINLANPMLKDIFECRLIKAFEITVENPVEFGTIKAIGLRGKEILIEESVDYFMRFYENNRSSVLLPFENIRAKNIREIRIISDDGKYKKKLKVSKYLKDYKTNNTWWYSAFNLRHGCFTTETEKPYN